MEPFVKRNPDHCTEGHYQLGSRKQEKENGEPTDSLRVLCEGAVGKINQKEESCGQQKAGYPIEDSQPSLCGELDNESEIQEYIR